MSWTKFTCFFAFCALLAAPVMAQPSLDIKEISLTGGQRTFGVYVTPDPALFGVDTNSDTILDASSMAIEIAISSINPQGGSPALISSTPSVTDDFLDDAVAPLGNPGDNPFTGTVTEGIVIEANQTDMFAALGSTGDLVNFPDTGLLSARTLAFSFTVDSEIAVFDVTGSVAQGDDGAGVVAEYTNALFGINGDYQPNGLVDIIDFGLFADDFGLPAVDAPASDWSMTGDTIDIIDFGLLADNFGLAMPGAGALSTVSVPEPGSIAIAGLALVGLALARGRRS